MKQELSCYGVKIVKRPKIKSTAKLDINGEQGQQRVKLEIEQILMTHKQTFQKLANM